MPETPADPIVWAALKRVLMDWGAVVEEVVVDELTDALAAVAANPYTYSSPDDWPEAGRRLGF